MAELARRLREEAPSWRYEVTMDAQGEAISVRRIKYRKVAAISVLPDVLGLPPRPDNDDGSFFPRWYEDFERRGGMEGAIERYRAAGKVVEEVEEG
jgi:hypothetical protein